MTRAATARQSLARIVDWAQARGLSYRHRPDTGFGAVFSQDGAYRYLLWRIAAPRAGLTGMGMLNPSTADEHGNDATIARCQRIAGGNLLVWNLFALRTTDPAALRLRGDPVGADNDAAIDLALSLCPRTVLAWGNHGSLGGRSLAVLACCQAAGSRLMALGTTRLGQPRHPLYLPGDTRPKVLRTRR